MFFLSTLMRHQFIWFVNKIMFSNNIPKFLKKSSFPKFSRKDTEKAEELITAQNSLLTAKSKKIFSLAFDRLRHYVQSLLSVDC